MYLVIVMLLTYTVATTDIFSKLKAKGYDRSFGIYTKDGVR